MLAIDEISMLDCTTLDYINQILKTIRKNDKPFGGIQVIIVGDFFQLPPVQIKKHERNFCFKSQAWKELNLQTIILKEVKRQTEKEFSNALNNVRMGKTSARNLKIFYKRNVENDCKISKDILQIFGTNADADAYNCECFNKISEKPYTYKAKDELYVYQDTKEQSKTILNTTEVTDKNISKEDLEELKRFNKYCKAPEKLELKKGCRVMLLKNINVKKGLANGSCGTIISLSSTSIEIYLIMAYAQL